MKTILLTLWLMGLGVGFGSQNVPSVIRMHVMTVGLSQAEYADWVRGEGDYESMMGLVKGGEAELMDVNVVTGRAGEKVTLESVREEIYPTEYDPPVAVHVVKPEDEVAEARLARPMLITAFETRNAGTTLVLEPTFGDDLKIVDLWVDAGFVDSVGYSLWQEWLDDWGRSDVKMPIYFTHRMNAGVVLRDGKFGVVSVFSAKDKDGKVDAGRKIVMFVKCERLVVGEGEE